MLTRDVSLAEGLMLLAVNMLGSQQKTREDTAQCKGSVGGT